MLMGVSEAGGVGNGGRKRGVMWCDRRQLGHVMNGVPTGQERSLQQILHLLGNDGLEPCAATRPNLRTLARSVGEIDVGRGLDVGSSNVNRLGRDRDGGTLLREGGHVAIGVHSCRCRDVGSRVVGTVGGDDSTFAGLRMGCGCSNPAANVRGGCGFCASTAGLLVGGGDGRRSRRGCDTPMVVYVNVVSFCAHEGSDLQRCVAGSGLGISPRGPHCAAPDCQDRITASSFTTSVTEVSWWKRVHLGSLHGLPSVAG